MPLNPQLQSYQRITLNMFQVKKCPFNGPIDWVSPSVGVARDGGASPGFGG